MIKKNYFYKILLLFFIFISCSTLKEKYKSERTYKIFKSSKKAESIFKIKIDKNGKLFGVFASSLISPAKIIGDIVEDDNQNITFYITSVRYLSNWPNGWTEGESKASGVIIFSKDENIWKAFLKEEFEILEVISGSIRYREDYYREESGFEKVKNRMNRIIAVIEFLKNQEYVKLPDFFGHAGLNSTYGESFKKTSQPFLFPETIGFDKLKTKNQLLVDYNIPIDQKGDLIIVDGLIWRKSYTDKFFPDILKEGRNSGALWRDYEEAIHLFFMLYNFDYYFENVINDASFVIIK